MSAPSAPVIPPRPARSPRTLGADIPSIPPRPVNRRLDRSVSPGRDSYAPSPLNGPPGLSRTTSNDVPARPPSVTIPSLGEEGIEYEELSSEPAETRNVGSDLKLHAPKPSLPTSSAKARVQAVTRTDSDQAAAAGFGKSSSPALEDSDQRSRSVHSKPSGSRAESAASSTRRQSMQFEEEHGIPEIGQRVPMLANAGDVQAPSPAPPRSGSATGQRGVSRHHHRTRSGRDVFLPPGSYGLHGHGVHAIDKFEKAWYDKHPDELAREEQGQYGPAIAERSAWALSSDDLNRLVKSSDVDISVGTSPAFAGTPAEEVGYIATDELTRQDTQPAVESPLRHSTFATSELTRSKSAMSTASSDGGRFIHVDEPYHSLQHPDGFALAPEPPSLNDHDDAAEDDEPILAADESRPGSAYLHPAVSPRRASADYHELERVRSRTPSAPNSRPTSLHGAPAGLTRWSSRGEEQDDVHTPLEDVEEYEPLFPEDEKSSKPLSAAERFQKRSELLKHHFPSQDIWEDTPDSLQLHASVSTPDLPEDQSKPKFETPEAEAQRKREADQIDSHKVASHILHGQGTQSRQTRPDTIKHRFPSRDVWEDAPESHQLMTTIEPSEPDATSPDRTKPPSIPSRPNVPPRPAKVARPSDGSTDEKKAPVIPDRPKPQIPARPSKSASGDATAPPVNRNKPIIPARPNGGKIAGVKANFLSDLNSRLQLGPQGPKPAVEKKEEEVPEEKAPLTDARKGRARGPARRKPAASSSSETRLPSIPEIRIMDAWNVWELGVDGNLTVGLPEKKQPIVEVKPQAPDADIESDQTAMAPPIAKNMAGEDADPVTLPEKSVEPEAESEIHEPAQTETIEHHEDSRTSDHVSPKQAVDQPTETIDTQVKSIDPEPTTEQIIEQLAATADGKKRSDGSIDTEETAA